MLYIVWAVRCETHLLISSQLAEKYTPLLFELTLAAVLLLCWDSSVAKEGLCRPLLSGRCHYSWILTRINVFWSLNQLKSVFFIQFSTSIFMFASPTTF